MLRVVYRSYGGENRKKRPDWFSKRLALISFLRSLDNLGHPHEIIYLNDGPIPADRLAIMGRSGEIIARQNLRLAGSLSAALDLPAARNWDVNDLVWLAEDDYLYLPDALSGLVEAARQFPHADYFALYAAIGHRPPYEAPQPSFAIVPSGWRDSEPVLVQGHPWRRALSTTSTFGARAGVLREDRLALDLAMRTGGAFDHTMCLISQGYLPFHWRSIFSPHAVAKPRLAQRARSAASRGGLNLWQIARRGLGAKARLWVAPDPALSTHLETEYMAVGQDWARIARDCLEWGMAKGLMEQAVDHAAIRNTVQDMMQEAAALPGSGLDKPRLEQTE